MLNHAHRRLLLLTATFALSLLSCGREVTGPENGIKYGRARFGAVSLDPQMPSLLASLEGAGSVVPFERVRVVLRRLDGSISVDTTVSFPVGADSIALSLLVPLPIDTPEEGLPLSLTMAYTNAAGDTVFRGGPVSVIAPPIGSSEAQQPVTIPVTYDGIGKDAARVEIAPDTGTRVAGTSSTFSATAFDGANAPISNTPIIFYTLDSTRASIPAAGTGQVTWLANRGVARIVAALPNGARADTAFVTVALPASKLVVQSGDAQSGIVNAALGEPVVLRTLALDDVPVAGVIVTFAVASGNGTLSILTDTSDLNGIVSTNWTLGAAVGAQSITATAAGLTGSPATLTATATPGAPAQLAFTQVATATTAGAVLTPPVLVAVQDVAGNVVTNFTGPVSVEATATSSGAVNGTLSVNAVAGVASFADLSFDVAGTYNLVALLDSTARDTSSAITVAPGAGAVLEFVEQPIGAVAGVAFAPPVTVIARDAQGNIATGFTGTITLSLLNANGATLGGALSAAAVNGLATFSSLTVDLVGLTYALAATSGALTADTSATFGIVPASPAAIALIAGDGQTAPASTILPNGIVVDVRDAFQNPIPGVTVNFSVIAGGGSSSSSSAVTDALGRAATTWTLGPVVGSQVLRAEVPSNPLATLDIAATATVGAPAIVAFTQSPVTQQVAGTPFPDVIVEVRDANGNVVTNFTGLVELSLGNTPSEALLVGTVSIAAVNGVATFPGVLLEIAGIGYTLQASTDTLSPATSTAFDVVNTTASVVLPVAGDGQTGTAGTLLADSLVVRVTDQFGNAVAGLAVAFNPTVGLGSVAPTVVTTNALGEAATTWTLGGSFGPQSVNAAILDGAAIYTFSATATVGAPATLTLEAGDAQTAEAGGAFPGPMRVLVTDAFGNRVLGAQVAWTGFAVNVAADTTFTDGNGVAEVVATAGTEVGGGGVTAVLVAAPSQFYEFSATIVSAAPSVPILEVQPSSATAGTPLAPFAVRVEDAFGNLATGFNGPVTLTAELTDGTPVSVIVAGNSVDAVNGLAEFSATRIDLAGTYRLVVDLGALGTVVSDSFTVSPTNPSQLLLVDGDAQTAGVTQPLATPLRVRVTDDFGNGVSGVLVNWGVVSGLAALTDTVTATDANGVAATTVTLGTASGAITIGAFAAGLTGSPVSFSATATAGAAISLVTISGDGQVAAAGAAFPLPLVVRVVDNFGNGVSGVDVTFDLANGASALSDTVVTTDADGFASVTATAATIANAEAVINVSAAGLSPAQFGVSVDVGAATELTYESLAGSGTAGVTYAPVVIAVRDVFGNIASTFSDSVTIAIGAGPAGAVLGGSVSRAPVSGLVTFDDLLLTTAGTYALTVSSGALSQNSSAIVVTAAAADSIAAEGAVERSGAVTSTIVPSLLVRITDAFGNPVSGETVSWSVASGSVTLSAQSSVTDTTGVAQIDVTAGTVAETASVLASAGSLRGSPVAFPIAVTAGPATQLTLEIGPEGGVSGEVTTPFTVAVRDATGNIAPDFIGDVTIVVDSGPSLTIGGTATVAATGGSATFDAVSFETAGTYRLRFTAPGVTDAVSELFQILPGAASALALTTDAAGAASGAAFTTQPVVEIRDALGNLVTTDNSTLVTLTVDGDGTVVGTDTATAVGGIATFAAAGLGGTAGNYTLTLSGAGLTVATQPITLSAGAAIALSIVTPAAGAINGAAFSTQPVVAVLDAYSNVVTTDNTSVVSVSFTGDGVTGTNTATAVAGIATFTDVGISGLTGTFDLIFSSAPLEFASQSIDLGPGEATTLVLDGEIGGNFIAGETISPFTVSAFDSYGNLATGVTSAITASIESGPVGATLGGTLAPAAVGGTASFSDLTLDLAGTYRLRFTASGLSDAVSTNAQTDLIVVTAAAATQLVVTSVVPDTIVAGTEVADFVVEARDSFGNLDVGFTKAISSFWSNPVAGIESGPTVDAVGGIATFTVSSFANPYGTANTLGGDASFTFFEPVEGGLPNTDVNFTVLPAAASALVVSEDENLAGGFGLMTEADGAAAGAAFTKQPVVVVRDTYGNLVTTDNSTLVTVTVSGEGTIVGIDTVTAAGGVATFTAAGLGGPAGNYTLTYSAAGLTAAEHGIALSAGTATALFVAIGAGDAVAGEALSPISIAARDDFGNIPPEFTAAITVAIDSGTVGATLGGTRELAAGGGTASFSDLSLDLAGTYRLRFTSPNLTGAVGGTFAITPAAPASVNVVSGDSQTGAVSALLPDSITVRVLDGFTNPIANTTVTFFDITGGGSASPLTATTNAAGEASTAWTLGSLVGTQQMTVTVSGFEILPATVSATAQPESAPLIQWTGGGGNDNWNNTANWDLNRLPVSTDSVHIDEPGGTVIVNVNATVGWLVIGESGPMALTHAGSTLTVDSVAFISPGSTWNMSGSAVLTGPGQFQMFGTMNWSGGTMSGTGATVIGTLGSLAVTGAPTLDSRDLIVAGDMTLGGTAFNGVGLPTLATTADGTIEFVSTTSYFSGNGVVDMVNAGTLRKAASAGLVRVDWPISNSGTLEVADDTLDLRNALTHAAGNLAILSGATLLHGGETQATAPVTIASGGRLQLQSGGISPNAGNHIFQAGSSISGLGRLAINSADTTRIEGTLDIDSLTVQNGNTWFDSPDTMFVTRGAYLGGGFFRGSGVLGIRGAFVLNAGNIVGTGTMSVLGGGSLTLRGMNGWGVDVASGATAIWGDYDMTFGQDTLNGIPYASLLVRTGGLLDVQHATTTPRELFALGSAQSPNVVFSINSGATVRKSTGSGVSNFRPRFEMAGTFDVLSGSINIQGTCAMSGDKTGAGAVSGSCGNFP